jgi:transketolase
MDAVQKANSGHPGTPMALAPVAYALWHDVLRTDPACPDWPNRDRFVLSVGHASMLLYAVLHLAGVEEIDADGRKTGQPAVSLADIEQFRQLGSKTPGHPEYRMTTGVETTTGPLGRAWPTRWAWPWPSRPGRPLQPRRFPAVRSRRLCAVRRWRHDGGHFRRSGLARRAPRAVEPVLDLSTATISIEGSTQIAFTEDVGARFAAYGWQVLHVDDANDLAALRAAFDQFRATTDKPTLIVVRSVIGWGSPRRQRQGPWRAAGRRRRAGHQGSLWLAAGQELLRARWREGGLFAGGRHAGPPLARGVGGAAGALSCRLPRLAAELDQLRSGHPRKLAMRCPPRARCQGSGLARGGRQSAQRRGAAPAQPDRRGGRSSPSTKTEITGAPSFGPGERSGRNLHFGVREHAMGAIANGLALSYLRPYTATFLVFADYMRARSALPRSWNCPRDLRLHPRFHRRGEDGPTHQPIEHLATLRAIPGLDTIRPGDANEVLWPGAWRWKARTTHSADSLAPGDPHA